MSSPSSDTHIERELATLLNERASAVPVQQPPTLPVACAVSLGNHQRPERRMFWLAAAALVAVLGAAAYAVNQNASAVATGGVAASEPGTAPVDPSDVAGEPTQHIIWMSTSVAQSEIADVAEALAAQLDVRSFEYVDLDATYAEFKEYWADTPEVLRAVEPQDLPTSFRLTVRGDPSTVLATIRGLSGVARVDTEPQNFDAVEFVEGESVLVVVGATWCPHCSVSLPAYIEVLNSLESTGDLAQVSVVGIEIVDRPRDAVSNLPPGSVWHQAEWPYELMVDDGQSFVGVSAFAIPAIMRWSPDGIVGEPLVADEVSTESLLALLAD